MDKVTVRLQDVGVDAYGLLFTAEVLQQSVRDGKWDNVPLRDPDGVLLGHIEPGSVSFADGSVIGTAVFDTKTAE